VSSEKAYASSSLGPISHRLDTIHIMRDRR